MWRIVRRRRFFDRIRRFFTWHWIWCRRFVAKSGLFQWHLCPQTKLWPSPQPNRGMYMSILFSSHFCRHCFYRPETQCRGEYLARNLKLDPDGGQKLFPNPNFARRQRRRASEKLGFIFKKRCKNWWILAKPFPNAQKSKTWPRWLSADTAFYSHLHKTCQFCWGPLLKPLYCELDWEREAAQGKLMHVRQ